MVGFLLLISGRGKKHPRTPQISENKRFTEGICLKTEPEQISLQSSGKYGWGEGSKIGFFKICPVRSELPSK